MRALGASGPVRAGAPELRRGGSTKEGIDRLLIGRAEDVRRIISQGGEALFAEGGVLPGGI
eukprot:scaffold617329_cov41-Prasinocladus_malaysianus.AAC.1